VHGTGSEGAYVCAYARSGVCVRERIRERVHSRVRVRKNYVVGEDELLSIGSLKKNFCKEQLNLSTLN
jgi:hypothetical protein